MVDVPFVNISYHLISEPELHDVNRTIDLSVQPSIHSLILSKRTNFGEKHPNPNPSVNLNNSFDIYETQRSENKNLNDMLNSKNYNRAKTYSLMNQKRPKMLDNTYLKNPSLAGSKRPSTGSPYMFGISNGIMSPGNLSPKNSNEK